MARTTILVSDLSGEQIAEGEYVHIAVTHGGKRYDLDVAQTEPEVVQLIEKGRPSKRRGRKRKNNGD